MDIVEKALQFASRAHFDQHRKNTDIPFISHPVAVGMILMKAGYSDDLIAAGLLHDTVEDTDNTLDDIQREFGANVAEIVAGCSEPDKSLSWKERKEHTLEFLKTASEDIRAVACADKLHNIRSIIRDFEELDDEVWNRFNAGKEQQMWYYTNIVNSLGYQSIFPLVEELQKEVERLFDN